MSASHVQTKDAQSSSGTSLNVSLTGVGAGNHLYTATTIGSGATTTAANILAPTSTPTATWANAVAAFVPAGAAGDCGGRADYSENVASGAWTVTGNSGATRELTVLVSESSGVKTSLSIGAVNHGSTNVSGTTIATGSVTPTAASILYTSVFDNGGTTTAGTIDNTFVVSSDATGWNGANQRGGTAHKDNVAASAVNPTWTVPTVTQRGALIVEFLAAAAAAAIPNKVIAIRQAVNRAATY